MSARDRMVKDDIPWISMVLIALTISFIWGNSFMDRAASSEQSDLVERYLRPYIDKTLQGYLPLDIVMQVDFRKLAHFSEFFVLGVALAGLCSATRELPLFFYPVMILLVAGIDEGIQHFSGRAPMLRDVLLDMNGGFSGFATLALLHYSAGLTLGKEDLTR